MLNLIKIMPNIGRVLNVKLGHTTNSSSTHYMLWKINRKQRVGVYPDDWGFGWKWKEYGTLKEKQAYGIAQLMESFAPCVISNNQGYRSSFFNEIEDIGMTKALEWVCSILEIPKEEVSEISKYKKEMYVDHQSQIYFPHMKGHKYEPNIQFIREWWAWIQRPEVIIYTGNDNEKGKRKYYGDRTVDSDLRGYYAVKDEEKDLWVLFNDQSGTRFIITFDENYNKEEEGKNV